MNSESFWWEQRESNPRPSACKADALNQLSYAPEQACRFKQDCKYTDFFSICKFFQHFSTERANAGRKSSYSLSTGPWKAEFAR